MKNLNNFIYLLLGIFLISLVSANGLNIENNTFEINKTYGVDEYFNITVSNQETFTFVNMTPYNDIISFDKFDLESGENKTMSVKINSNSEFNGDIKIIGEYWAELGSSDITETVEIGSSGVDICNLDLIQGDTIIWKNTISGDVKIKNLNSGEYMSTIEGGSEYTNKFEEAMEFDYQVYKTGLPFSQICHLNIRATSGYIHSSEYDTSLNLNLKINYEPTTIETIFLTDYYTMDYNSEEEDVLKITNTGINIGKDIWLSGDWMTFYDSSGNELNNFDLAPGESKTISYKIKPLVYETEQTNRTYNNSIKINGNFEEITKEIEIFINYKKIGGLYGNSSYNKEELINMVNFICSIYPEDCPTTIIYGNESDRNVTFVINQEAYYEKISEDGKFQEIVLSTLGNQNEKLDKIENNSNAYLNNSNEITLQIIELTNKTEDLNGGIITGVAIFLIIIIVSVVGFIFIKSRGKIKLNKLFHKRELSI